MCSVYGTCSLRGLPRLSRCLTPGCCCFVVVVLLCLSRPLCAAHPTGHSAKGDCVCVSERIRRFFVLPSIPAYHHIPPPVVGPAHPLYPSIKYPLYRQPARCPGLCSTCPVQRLLHSLITVVLLLSSTARPTASSCHRHHLRRKSFRSNASFTASTSASAFGLSPPFDDHTSACRSSLIHASYRRVAFLHCQVSRIIVFAVLRWPWRYHCRRQHLRP